MLRTTGSIDNTTAFRAWSRSGRRWQRSYSIRGAGATPDPDAGATSRDNPPTSEDATAGTHVACPPPGQTQQSSLNPPPRIDIGALRGRLKDWGILASFALRRRAGELSKRATTTVSHLGLHLSRVTGYDEIEALKRQVVEQEARIKATRRAAREAKAAYDDAVLQRSISHRQVNDLLQRKSSWTDTDVSDFTSLVRSDHSFEQEEARAKARVAEAEDAVDREFSELMRVILARYHEEQVWSDKIRSVSTYGSLAALGVNLVVFIMAIIVVEPWKRKRLAQTFEQKVEEMGAETKALINAGAVRLEERLTGHEKLLTRLVAQVSTEARQTIVASATVTKEAPPEETPATTPPHWLWWPQTNLYPHSSAVWGHDLMLVAGGAVVGGVMVVLTRSLFAH